MLIQRARAQINLMKTGDDKYRQQLSEFDKELLEHQKPKNFNSGDPQNDVVKHKNSYNQLIANLEDCGVSNPEKITVYKFYQRLRYYKKKFKAQLEAQQRKKAQL